MDWTIRGLPRLIPPPTQWVLWARFPGIKQHGGEVVLRLRMNVATPLLPLHTFNFFFTSHNISKLYVQTAHSTHQNFIVPTDAHYYKIIEMLKQFKDYNTGSEMFWFTQEPSSGMLS
jgi:hypothetical protein